jgi:hypothetical protein
MSNAKSSCLTERHLILFGTISQAFLRHEKLMQEIMATIMGSDIDSVMILTDSLTFDEKRDALVALLLDWRVPVDQINMIRAYFLCLEPLDAVRGDIERSAWTAGPTSGSIVRGSVRRRSLENTMAEEQWLKDFEQTGHMESRGYDLESLGEIAETLDIDLQAFEAYVCKVGLISGPDDKP